MKTADLRAIVRWCDHELRVPELGDYSEAHNGLQVENRGKVVCIAAAVDATMATVRKAIAAKANLLIVHHGLFWSKSVPWTGKRMELIRLLVENDIAVYSAHLPLDAHPKLGNNAGLARAIGLRKFRPFFESKGYDIGLRGELVISRAELMERLEKVLAHRVTLLPGGAEQCRQIGIVTGGAGSELKTAAAAGVDTFITGEGPHWTYALAEEAGINVLYGGHYATETFGVKSLAEALGKRFKVPWVFIDHPTGL